MRARLLRLLIRIIFAIVILFGDGTYAQSPSATRSRSTTSSVTPSRTRTPTITPSRTRAPTVTPSRTKNCGDPFNDPADRTSVCLNGGACHMPDWDIRVDPQPYPQKTANWSFTGKQAFTKEFKCLCKGTGFHGPLCGCPDGANCTGIGTNSQPHIIMLERAWYDKGRRILTDCPAGRGICLPDLSCEFPFDDYDLGCTLCADGYYADGNVCFECPTPSAASLIIVGALVLVSFIFLLLLIRFGSSSLKFIASMTSFVQVLPLLISLGGYSVHPDLRAFVALFSVLSLDLSVLGNEECFLPAGVSTEEFNIYLYTFYLAFPILLVLMVYCLQLVQYCCIQFCHRVSKERSKELRLKHSQSRSQSLIVFLGLYYFPLAVKSTTAFRCIPDIIGRPALQGSSMLCTGDEYTSIQVLAGCAIVLWGLGIPLYFTLVLRSRPHLAFARSPHVLETLMNAFIGCGRKRTNVHGLAEREQYEAAMISFYDRYSTLCLEYRFHLFFWEILLMVRRFALVVVYVFASGVLRVISVFVIITMFFVPHIKDTPYRTAALNYVETINTIVQLIVCMVMLIASEVGVIGDSDTGLYIAIFIIVIASAALIGALVASVAASRQRVNRWARRVRMLKALYSEDTPLAPTDATVTRVREAMMRRAKRKLLKTKDEENAIANNHNIKGIETILAASKPLSSYSHDNHTLSKNRHKICKECRIGSRPDLTAAQRFKCAGTTFSSFSELFGTRLLRSTESECAVYPCMHMTKISHALLSVQKDFQKIVHAFHIEHPNPFREVQLNGEVWFIICMQLGAIRNMSGLKIGVLHTFVAGIMVCTVITMTFMGVFEQVAFTFLFAIVFSTFLASIYRLALNKQTETATAEALHAIKGYVRYQMSRIPHQQHLEVTFSVDVMHHLDSKLSKVKSKMVSHTNQADSKSVSVLRLRLLVNAPMEVRGPHETRFVVGWDPSCWIPSQLTPHLFADKNFRMTNAIAKAHDVETNLVKVKDYIFICQECKLPVRFTSGIHKKQNGHVFQHTCGRVYELFFNPVTYAAVVAERLEANERGKREGKICEDKKHNAADALPGTVVILRSNNSSSSSEEEDDELPQDNIPRGTRRSTIALLNGLLGHVEFSHSNSDDETSSDATSESD